MKFDLKTAKELTSDEARDTLLMFRNYGDDPLVIQENFRGLFPKKIAEALGEVRALRRRALVKFSRGLDMFFARSQLQQASSEAVANHRAKRFAAAGLKTVVDPCCGIGADSIAFAQVGLRVIASDKDPAAVHFAAINAEVYEVETQIEFLELDCLEADLAKGAIWLDPSRRRGSRRIMNPDDWSPPPDRIREILQDRPAAGLKLSPATPIEKLLEIYPEPGEIEIISLKGEAKETVFWYGSLVGKENRRATALPSNGSWAGPLDADASVGEFGSWFYDPDPSLTLSGQLGSFAQQYDLQVVDSEIGYLTSKSPIFHPLVDTFRVLAVEALDPRKMRAILRDLKVDSLEIRKRGIAERPLTIEKRMLPKSYGDRRLTLLATRVGDRHIGVVAELVQEEDLSP